MALYEDYLNQNNLYSRPSALMSDVNDYLGGNQAKLPLKSDDLGSMLNLRPDDSDPFDRDSGSGHTFTNGANTDYDDVVDPEDLKGGPNIQGQDPGLLSKFMDKLGSLQPGHRALLLKYLGTEEGDLTAGVSAGEWAQIFGLSDEYSGRFQGFPNLLQLQDDIRNVYAGGEQRRGHEMKSAQEAMIQSRQRPTGLKMGGATNAMMRRQMEDTLSQRLFATQENTASQYANLLSLLDSRINTGFNIAGDILNMNPDARSQTRVGPGGELITYGGDDGLTTKDTSRTTRRT